MQTVEIRGKMYPRFAEIVSKDSLEFVAELQRKFGERREQLLLSRFRRQEELDAKKYPTFLADTNSIRNSPWKVVDTPKDLKDRRVEITGPSSDAKMVINAFNSGASTFMADFEDAQSPTWYNTIQGQINLYDAVRRNITYESNEGKKYVLSRMIATLIVRPRGWHLPEKHVYVDGRPMSASLFDFGFFIFHNWRELLSIGSGPYFYLPKIESRFEARLWNDVFSFSEDRLEIPQKSIKATVLIETILASFEMDEILYELKNYCIGLNCGRWDYIFSFIKKFREDSHLLLPDRSLVTMDRAFLKAYVDLLIKTCHNRGAYAIGGMSAFIPVKGDEKANRAAFEKVKEDKEREAKAGHDGTWVAHPGLVPVAKEVFDRLMPSENQIILKPRLDAKISKHDLLKVPDEKDITEKGVVTNVSVGLQYLEAWLGGRGAVPINNLMEDAATAEICRAQIWQWIRHGAKRTDGRTITREMFSEELEEEKSRIRTMIGDEEYVKRYFEQAGRIFSDLILAEQFTDFLTLPAYEQLLKNEDLLQQTN